MPSWSAPPRTPRSVWLLAEPRQTISKTFGVAIPPTFRIRFIEKEPDLDALVVLPDLKVGGDELSNGDLDAANGGQDSNCIQFRFRRPSLVSDVRSPRSALAGLDLNDVRLLPQLDLELRREEGVQGLGAEPDTARLEALVAQPCLAPRLEDARK